MRANRTYVTHTLTIRKAYAGYARHTLNMLKVCYSYVMNMLGTQVKACSRDAELKVVHIISFSEICIRFLKFKYAIHTL